MSVLWMCSGLAYYFFSPLSLRPPITVCRTIFMIVKCFFVLSRAWDQEDIVFSRGLRIFSLSHSQDKIKKVFCFSFTDLENYNDIFLIQFYNKGSENLVLDQPTMTLSTYFFIPITCFLDIVRINSVLVIHIS